VTGNMGLCDMTVCVSYVSSGCIFLTFMKLTVVVSESGKVNG